MSNSSLVEYTKISPNNSGKKKYPITRITPHIVVGQCTIASLGNWFYKKSTKASSNYGIDKNGKIGLFVNECDRAWTSSNADNDNRAITIECASDTVYPYKINDIVWKKLNDLCFDICKRNGKTKLIWFGDKQKALSYVPKSNEMVLTVHRWFASTQCCGDYLYSLLYQLADNVTERLRKDLDVPYCYHTVRSGETLWGIAVKYYGNGYKYEDIMKANDMSSTMIHRGDILKIPLTW